MVSNWTGVDSNKSIKALEVVPTEFAPAAIEHSIMSMRENSFILATIKHAGQS
jgi:hypothetical protein